MAVNAAMDAAMGGGSAPGGPAAWRVLSDEALAATGKASACALVCRGHAAGRPEAALLLPAGCGPKVAARRFRRLSLLLHPDRAGPGDDREGMVEAFGLARQAAASLRRD